MGKPVILQVLPALETGGVERGTVEMAEAITRAGWTSLVASVGGRLVAEIERAGARHVTLPLRAKNPACILSNAARLARLIRAERVDIVHARSRAPAWSAWLACRRTGTHFVTTYHGAYGEDLPFKRAYNGVMARGEVVIAASRFIAELIQTRHRIEAGRIRVIPRGIDPARFDPDAVPAASIERLRAIWGVPNGAAVVLLPGRLTRWKGQAVLIEAAARLSSPVHVVLAGSDQGRTAYSTELRETARSHGIADRVHLPGDCNDMPAALMVADVVVHASTAPEAFGRVVIEAQAMRRPVIASDLGGPIETVQHGVTGWRVPAGDAEALARVIANVLAIPAPEKAAIGAAAREAVLARCTTTRMQADTLGIYSAIMTGATGAPHEA